MKLFKLISMISWKMLTIYDKKKKYWVDIIIIIILVIIAALASYKGSQLIGIDIFNRKGGYSWFEGDTYRVFVNMIMRGSNHYRTKVHPLFSLIGYIPVYVLKMLLGGIELKPSMLTIMIVRIVIAGVASLWFGTLFILLRLIGCCRFDAILFSLMAAASAASIFWLTVPESYSFGSLSILLVLAFVALSQYYKLPKFLYVVFSGLSLSITLTNWMVGILATVVNYSWHKSWQITLNALSVVVALWSVQKALFPTAEFFISNQREEMHYINTPESGGPLIVIQSFIFHTIVMPAIHLVNKNPPVLPSMLTQSSLAGSGSLWGGIAISVWIALLSLGVWALFSIKQHPKLRIVLGVTIIGQLGLHILYGNETFLYALHFCPLLIVLAALSTLTPARQLALILAATLTLSAGINNGLQFNQARELFNSNNQYHSQIGD